MTGPKNIVYDMITYMTLWLKHTLFILIKMFNIQHVWGDFFSLTSLYLINFSHITHHVKHLKHYYINNNICSMLDMKHKHNCSPEHSDMRWNCEHNKIHRVLLYDALYWKNNYKKKSLVCVSQKPLIINHHYRMHNVK